MQEESKSTTENPLPVLNQTSCVNVGSDFMFVRDSAYLLGSGQFGDVYRGIRKNLPQEAVAIKVIRRAKCKPKSLKREIMITKALNHPNIMRMYYAGEKPLEIYLVLEYCSGGCLEAYLDQHKPRCLPEAEAYSIISQIFSALTYCVSLPKDPVIHRDLKPENILFHDGIVKVCDFGLARTVKDPEKPEFLTGGKGSPIYMAPEVLQKNRYFSNCDIWSLGIILYECLVGRVPWVGWEKWYEVEQLKKYIDDWELEEDPAFKSLSVDNLLKTILRRTLVKNPMKRARFHELAVLFQQPSNFEIHFTGEFEQPLETIDETKKEDLTMITETSSNQTKAELFDFSIMKATLEEETKAEVVFLKNLFIKNGESLQKFGNVHNCYTSKYKNPAIDLERTAENPKIDLVDDFEMLGQTNEGPMQVETPSEIDIHNILKMLRESSESVTKGEETISFRLNQVYFTRKLIDGILKEWMNLEKLVEISRKDLFELIGALLKIEVQTLMDMSEGLEKKEELPKQFYLSKSCNNCYGPLIGRNIEVSVKKMRFLS